ncbi:MAG: endonuclease MutS2 [Nitrospirota bacterium]
MITTGTLRLLEFDKLLNLISGNANSDISRKEVLNIRPLKSRAAIEMWFGLISEIMRISHCGDSLRLEAFEDLTSLLSRVRPNDAVLEPRELSAFIPVMRIASEMSAQIREREDSPLLNEITAQMTGFPHIRKALERSFDGEGNMRDEASPELADIRKKIRSMRSRIQKRLGEMMRDENLSVFIQADFVTERSGRWVIPVRMDSKGQVPGVVHDVSRTGETAFIEPLSIIGLSNELENLVADERSEEIRILKRICSKIRDVTDGIREEFMHIVHIDVLNSVAGFSGVLKMETPQLNDDRTINLSGARHPLLMHESLRKNGYEKVVPLDVRLGGDNSVMVITGSNAGGKTVAIKTIGLLIVMALSGMPLPASSSSSLPFVGSILIDIGDEQSIENNLSTFSAHVSNIAEILKMADSDALVLIDELGTGTDPDEGAALSCIILEELKKSGALVFATTHLAAIKGFVHKTEAMINAAMEFDLKTLSPLYRLRVGEPGQSHALEIAERYGLPESMIASARKMLGGVRVGLDNLIADLNEKRLHYENEIREVRRLKQEVAEKESRLTLMLAEADKKYKEVTAKAHKDALEIVYETRRQMHALIDELKRKEKSDRKEVLKKVQETVEALSEKATEYQNDREVCAGLSDIKEGDVVFVRPLGYDASVVKVIRNQNRLRVRAGSVEIEVPAADISPKRGLVLSVEKRDRKDEGMDDSVQSELNIVGLRVEEAMSRLEPFLNHASLAGLSELKIIHGIGSGILSNAVREHLKGHPLIKKFRGGIPSEGGSGVTIVTLA